MSLNVHLMQFCCSFFLYWPSTKYWLHTNQNMLAIVFEMCPFLFWWKSNHSFLFCKLVVQAKIRRFPIWWKHFHFFLMITLSLFENICTFSHEKHFHFFLMAYFPYTFFHGRAFTLLTGKLSRFFLGSLSIIGQFCDNTFL